MIRVSKTFIIFIIFFASQSHAEPFISACDRSPAIRAALEGLWARPCKDILRIQINTTQYLEIWSDNEVEIKADDLAEMAELENLYIRGPDVLKIDPRAFENTPKLHDLSILAAPMNELNAEFTKHLRGLRKLFVVATGLHTIQPGAFANLPNLTHLNLASNEFTKIDRAMLAGAYNLTFVDLSNCENLQEIEDDTFAGSTHMQQIDLGFSPLKSTTKGALHGIPNVQGLPADFGIDGDDWGGQ